MKKRLVAVVLTTIMCISLSGLPSFSISSVEAADITEQADVSAVDPWDGTAETAWYAGGKEEFTLNTPEELAGFAQLVNRGDTFEGKKILLQHGDRYSAENVPKNCGNALIYGHYHTGFLRREGGVVVANCGSVSLPKGGTPRSYILLDGDVLYLKDLEGRVLDSLRI